MRRVVSILLLLFMMSALLAGCKFWSDEQVYIEPYRDNKELSQSAVIKVSTYKQLETTLVDAIHDFSGECTIAPAGVLQDSVESMLDRAITYVINDDPFGAYAVKRIDYEPGVSGGESVIAVRIEYLRQVTELLKIRSAADVAAAKEIVSQSLDNCETGVVIYLENYEDTDFVQYIADYAHDHPNMVMEVPQVVASAYPEEGDSRIVELLYTYQTSRDELRMMQQSVEPVFTSAELYVRGGDDHREKYDQLYSFLMERYTYKVETSITPAYSLLCHGVGDCRAFANVYAAMCRNAGLDCTVVSGTRDAEAWFWNRICIDGDYYYVDLLRCRDDGRFKLRKDTEMDGYVWDYSAQPRTV